MMDRITPERLSTMTQYYEDLRKTIDEDASRGDASELVTTFHSFTSMTSSRVVMTRTTVEELEMEIHNNWYIAIQAAKNYSHGNANQDALVMQILRQREIGTLSHAVKSPETGLYTAVLPIDFAGQRIWKDLPFLAEDICMAWDDFLNLPANQRRNLAAFLARLVSVGVCTDALAGCALMLFREALEAPRAFESSPDSVDLSIADLLPSLESWLEISGDKLIALSEQQMKVKGDMSLLGTLAIDAGVAAGGFHPSRWMFWKSRLEFYAQPDSEWPTYCITDESSAKERALHCWSTMRNNAEHINGVLTDPIWSSAEE